MEIGFTEDQSLFRDVVRRFLEDKSPTAEVRRIMESTAGFDLQVWNQAAQEVGLTGIHLPEEFGGSGFGAVELGIVAEEMGRHLFCSPFFASAVMAGYAISNEGTSEQKSRWLPGIADGSCIATLVLDDLNTLAGVGRQIQATQETLLSGSAPLVIDAQIASTFVVAARSEAGIAFYLVPADSTGIAVQPLEVVDSTRKLCRVDFTDVGAERLGDGRAANLALLWDQLCAVLANEMVGGATRLFETTLDYLKLRVQFGRTIGSFQALKHRCADLLMELELARAAAYAASREQAKLASGLDADPCAAHVAKALASDAYMQIARQAIQLRGGIGFTWEEDTHLWFKRAKSSEVLLGSSAWHRDQMINRLMLEPDMPRKESANA